jgi:GxxExxY protein
MKTLIHKKDAYSLIGICMEVHRELGQGFSEIVYKDALEYELKQRGIHFEREKLFKVLYKDVILTHHYVADFVVRDKIILELKAVSELRDEHLAQTINYLAVSGLDLGLLINFRAPSLEYRRVVYSKYRKPMRL